MSTIEELERKIRQLEEQLIAQKEETDLTLEQAKRAAEFAKHAYRVDHYGFIWVWDIDAKDYKKSNMRVMNPIIADKALQSRHLSDGCVEGRHLQDNIIEGKHFKEKTIGGEKIQNQAIGSSQLKDKAIGSQHLQQFCVTNSKIMPGAVDVSKIAPNTLDGHDIFLNSNLITFQIEEDGWWVAYFGNRGPITGFMRDEEGWVYALYGYEPQTVSQ